MSRVGIFAETNWCSFCLFLPWKKSPFILPFAASQSFKVKIDCPKSEGIKGRNCLILNTAWHVYSGHDYSWLFLYRFGRCIDRALFPQTAFSFSVNGLALVVRLTRQKNKSDSASVHTFPRSQSGLHDTFACARWKMWRDGMFISDLTDSSRSPNGNIDGSYTKIEPPPQLPSSSISRGTWLI